MRVCTHREENGTHRIHTARTQQQHPEPWDKEQVPAPSVLVEFRIPWAECRPGATRPARCLSAGQCLQTGGYYGNSFFLIFFFFLSQTNGSWEQEGGLSRQIDFETKPPRATRPAESSTPKHEDNMGEHWSRIVWHRAPVEKRHRCGKSQGILCRLYPTRWRD